MITWHYEDPEGSAGEEARLDTAGDAVRDGEHRGELTNQRTVLVLLTNQRTVLVTNQKQVL